MKYQQIEDLECQWKCQYLLKKWREGEGITRYQNDREASACVEGLKKLVADPEGLNQWIAEHIAPELNNKLKQAIRAKRKRHFNAASVHTKKKSIDLDYAVWEKLSQRAQELGCTLSDAVEYLVTEASRTEQANKKVSSIKEDLAQLLDFEL